MGGEDHLRRDEEPPQVAQRLRDSGADDSKHPTTEEARAVFLRIAAEWEGEIDAIQNGVPPVTDTSPTPIKPRSLLSYVFSLFGREREFATRQEL